MFNRTLSYSSYVLSYQVEKQQYNVSVLTRIISVNGTDLFMTMVNIGPRDSKAQPVADIVFFTNKTNLAEHYRILAEVLNQIRKGDETGWVWNKAKNELNYLSRVVEMELEEYNVEGYGSAIVIDSSGCSYLCNITCGSGFAILCLAGTVAGGPWVGLACSVLSSVGCTKICGDVCNEPVNLVDLGCSAGCYLSFIKPVCRFAGLGAPICEKFMSNIGICTLICDQVGNLYGE